MEAEQNCNDETINYVVDSKDKQEAKENTEIKSKQNISENMDVEAKEISPVKRNSEVEPIEIIDDKNEPIEIADDELKDDLNTAIIIKDSDGGESSDDVVVVKEVENGEFNEGFMQDDDYCNFDDDDDDDDDDDNCSDISDNVNENDVSEDEISENELENKTKEDQVNYNNDKKNDGKSKKDMDKLSSKEKRKLKRGKFIKHKSIQYGFDPKENMTIRKLFVLAAVEQFMYWYWPQPISDFFCRCCNYLEFGSEEQLEKHKETEDHKARKINEAVAYCLVCQVHNLNIEGMKKHTLTERHIELAKFFTLVEKRASIFYEKHKDDEFKNRDGEKEKTEEEVKKQEEDDTKKRQELEKLVWRNKHSYFDRTLLERDIVAALDRYDYKEHTKAQYIFLISDVSLAPQVTKPSDKFLCNICNWKEFDTIEELKEHRTTKDHYTFEKRFRFICDFCKLHFETKEKINAHNHEPDHQRNKKMVNIVKQLVHQFRNRFILRDKELKITEPDIKFTDDVKPPHGDFIGPSTCELCNVSLADDKVKEIHKFSVEHKQKLWEYFLIRKDQFIHQRGCTLCDINLGNPGFFRASHHNFIGHKNRLRKFKEFIGISEHEDIELPMVAERKDQKIKVAEKLLLKKQAFLKKLEERAKDLEERDGDIFKPPEDLSQSLDDTAKKLKDIKELSELKIIKRKMDPIHYPGVVKHDNDNIPNKKSCPDMHFNKKKNFRFQKRNQNDHTKTSLNNNFGNKYPTNYPPQTQYGSAPVTYAKPAQPYSNQPVRNTLPPQNNNNFQQLQNFLLKQNHQQPQATQNYQQLPQATQNYQQPQQGYPHQRPAAPVYPMQQSLLPPGIPPQQNLQRPFFSGMYQQWRY